MSVRQILQIGNPKLKRKNKLVSKTDLSLINKIIKNLVDTLEDAKLVGISGPQIGENCQIFVTELNKNKLRPLNQTDKLRVYINPKIIYFSKEDNIIYEGCGSVSHGDLFGPVKRPRKIIIEAYNENLDKFKLECDGILARVIQHEYDHLEGIEFTEKITDYKKLISRGFYLKEVKESSRQNNASTVTVKKYSRI